MGSLSVIFFSFWALALVLFVGALPFLSWWFGRGTPK